MPRAKTSLMLLLTCAGVTALAACRDAEPPAVRLARSEVLPGLDGRPLRVSLLEVTYAPGESSPRHGHPCPVIGYVVDGAVRMHVEGQRPDVYRSGETFYEPKGSVHEVSANDSREFPARFLAWFICDADVALGMALTDPTPTKEDRR